MVYTAAVITVSDDSYAGEIRDTTGPAAAEMLAAAGWEVVCRTTVPNDFERIKSELVRCSYNMRVCLVLTTGGTGFSRRDVTPEATEAVIDRRASGIAEAMRAATAHSNPSGMLSRAVSGLRSETLIINLPGKEAIARECLAAVLPNLKHGIDMLRGEDRKKL